MNTFKTMILLTALTFLFIFIGGSIAGERGMVIAFILAIGMNFVSYWYSDKIVLAMYQAQPVSETEAPQLYQIVRRLCERAKLPMPKIYIIPSTTPNAFATGRNPQHAAVAVTEGILRLLNSDELEGVIGHELAHVRNRDILISSIAATIAGAIMLLSRMAYFAAIFGGYGGRDRDRDGGGLGLIITMIVAPIAALLIQMAISRSREYLADASGSRICGKPLALASALARLHQAAEAAPLSASPATAHMFIVNPLKGEGVLTLFSTHPPVEERITRLRELAQRIEAI